MISTLSTGAGPRGAGGDHAARHVHHPGQHPELPAAGGLHQGGFSVYNDPQYLHISTRQAIDVWSGVCVFFVFGALLEYAMVNYASR